MQTQQLHRRLTDWKSIHLGPYQWRHPVVDFTLPTFLHAVQNNLCHHPPYQCCILTSWWLSTNLDSKEEASRPQQLLSSYLQQAKIKKRYILVIQAAKKKPVISLTNIRFSTTDSDSRRACWAWALSAKFILQLQSVYLQLLLVLTTHARLEFWNAKLVPSSNTVRLDNKYNHTKNKTLSRTDLLSMLLFFNYIYEYNFLF